MTEPEDASSSIAAVFLTNQTSSNAVQLLGSVLLPPRDEKVSTLRDVVSSAFPAQLCENEGRGFVFVSRHGWELSESLEREVKVPKLLFDDQSIRVRATLPKHRVGVLLCPTDAPAEAIGFVFVEKLTCSVADFRTQFEEQHPKTPEALSGARLALLDTNGWPLTSRQESSLLLLDILTDCCVRARKLNGGEEIDAYNPNISFTHSRLHGVAHQKSRVFSTRPPSYAHSMSGSALSTQGGFEIMISYIHKEATKEAIALRDEFRKLSYSVFLDVDCIKPGVDWQDTLNEAVYKTSLFVPLVTPQYGLTEWTNREVKLADTLNKLILPVNFLPEWPPMCLAIQFASTQYVQWTSRKESERRDVVQKVARQISEFYVKSMEMDDFQVSGTESEDQDVKPESREEPSPPCPVKSRFRPLCKQKSLCNFGSLLPKCMPKSLRDAMMKPSSGKPMVIISCHPLQLETASEIEWVLQRNGYEAWITSIKICPKKTHILDTLKQKMSDAAAVIFVISKDYCDCSNCEKIVFYFEGRKRLIPVMTDTIKLPDWMSTLIGFEHFLDIRRETFQQSLLAQLEITVNPEKAEEHIKEIERQKAELVKMAVDLEKALPSEGRMVYISGGTCFFSDIGEAICTELGERLARQEDIVLVTGGFYGVGETVGKKFYEERKKLGFPDNVIHIQAKKDKKDRRMQTRQNPDRTFQPLPYGKTLFFCNSVHQREMLTPKVVRLCVLIEGGPGASFEAQQFIWNDHTVIPIKVTGGAAGGLFNSPPGMFDLPSDVSEDDWQTLQDTSATPASIAAAVTNVINSLQPPPSFAPGSVQMSNQTLLTQLLPD